MGTPLSIALLLSVVYLAYAVPSPSSVGADLTFLFQNDLNWPTAPNHNGTLLLNTPRSFSDSALACGLLNESPLPTTGTYFESDMTSLLRYMGLRKLFPPSQQFWISASKKSQCRVISLQHGIKESRCDLKLPILCSQSAPYRRNTNVDMNPNFQVQVESGKLSVLGTRDHLSFRFLGIPYADPVERFAYSQEFSGGGQINALNYGSPCTQFGYGTEDCLFLNIYTPYLPRSRGSESAKSLKPVMFWIHGGGFTGGEGSDSPSDGGNLVSRGDVVVVSINYRLGTLGFLALNDGVTNGNYGIADQITALKWVHNHIADFGGDPSRVTIFGGSAGAGSVRALLAAKPAFGLFQGAIAESNLGGFGYATTYSKYLTISQEYASFAEPVVESVGCGNTTDVLGCLRALPAMTLINAPNAPRYIVVDGTYITTDQLEVDGSGPVADAHVMFGWMRDDGADFIGSFPTTRSTLIGSLLAAGVSNDVANLVASNPQLFPLPSGSNSTLDLFNLTARIGTDGQFLCVDQATLYSASQHSVFRSVYAFQFDRSYAGYEPIPGICDPPPTPTFPNGDPSLPYFRCHGGDMYYVFGSLGQDSQPFRDKNDLTMSQVTVDMWTAFAWTYDPNPSPQYLEARGYLSTAAAVKGTDPWGRITPGSVAPVRVLDIPASNSQWREQEQCDLLGYPLTLFG